MVPGKSAVLGFSFLELANPYVAVTLVAQKKGVAEALQSIIIGTTPSVSDDKHVEEAEARTFVKGTLKLKTISQNLKVFIGRESEYEKSPKSRLMIPLLNILSLASGN